MATLRLTASSYQFSNTSYLTSSTMSNAYTNIDSTTKAQVNHGRNATTAYYVYLRGFDFSQIPSDAIITSAIVKVKAYVSGYSAQRPVLYNNTTAISNAPTFSSTIGTGTSGTTSTVDITSQFATYKGYGNNFGIRFSLGRSSRNTASYLYIFGAEITIEYTLPVYYTLTTSGANCTVTPSGTTSIEQGDNVTIKFEGNQKPTVTDNGTDVTSKLVEKTSELSYTVETASGASYGFATNSSGYYESQNKGKASTTALCTVNFDLPVECTVTFSLINYAESTYDYGLLSNVDTMLSTSASADTSNVFWNGENNNSSSVQTVNYTVPAGQHYICVKYFKDSYTNSNNDTLQFKVVITPNETITSDVFWVYEITNVQGNHTIIATVGQSEQLLIKNNGSWVNVTTVYKKINNVWVEQTDLKNLFDTTANYMKGD